jgi:hypothetical protein
LIWIEVLMSWPDWDLMFNGDAEGRSRRDLLRWWEARRIRYNLLVGIVGFVTWWLVMIAGSAAVKPGVDFEEPIAMIMGPFFYAIAANVCYTLGSLVDFIRNAGVPSKLLFKTGLILSLVITSLPGLWALIAWIGTLVTGHKLD